MGYTKVAFKGVSWMAALRGSTRMLVVVKLAILGRILTPTQFGVFGIANLALALLEVFTETGVNVFLIQENKNLKKYVSTAWIISMVRGLIISTIIVALAKLVSVFFKSPDSYQLILLIGAVPFIRGFINPSIIKFRKNLDFNKEFYFRFVLSMSEILVTVFVAVTTRSPIGLVWGIIASALLEVVLSQVLIKPRPTFSFNRSIFFEIFRSGKWVTAKRITTYLFHNIDDAVVGRVLNTFSLGLYQVAYKLSTLPLTEVTQVTAAVTFPVYTKIGKDKKRLRRAFIRTFSVTLLAIIPVGLMLSLFPKQIIGLLMGTNWLEASEILRILAIFGILVAIKSVPDALFLSQKKQKWMSIIQATQLAALILFIYPMVTKYGAIGAGYASIIAVLIVLPIVFYYVKKVIVCNTD